MTRLFKAAVLILLFFLPLSLLTAAEKDIQFGGSLNFTFGDPDVFSKPGPQFNTDNTGSAGDVNLYFRNRKVQAGLTLSLAQAAENVTSIGTEDEVPFPLDNAYLRCSDVGDLLEIKLHLRGEETSLGTMAVTDTEPDPIENKLDYQKQDGILTIAVERGVLGDFVLALRTNQIEGRAATATLEALDNIWGLNLITGYQGEYFYIDLEAGVMNLKYPKETFVTTIETGGPLFQGSFLELYTEAAIIGLNPGTIAAGGGAELELTFSGFSPKFGIFLKNGNYGKDEDLLSISGSRDDFNTRTGDNHWGWEATLSYNPKLLLGFNFISIFGGFNQVVTTPMRWGWNTGFNLNFYHFDRLPLTGGFSIGQFGDDGLGIFGNSDLLWNAFLSYNYHGIELKAEAGQAIYEDPMDPSGGNRNSALGYTISALVYF